MTAHHQPQPGPRTGATFRDLRVPILSGAVVGVLQTLTPFSFWWLPPATV